MQPSEDSATSSITLANSDGPNGSVQNAVGGAPAGQQLQESLSFDLSLIHLGMTPKKKKSFMRSVKKASSKAVRRFGTFPKVSTGVAFTDYNIDLFHQRRTRVTAQDDLQKIFAPSNPEMATLDAKPVNTSMDSLTAVRGSPAIDRFEHKAPLSHEPEPESTEVVKKLDFAETRARLPPPPPGRLSPLQLALLKSLARAVLFVPYTALVGFLPFLAPAQLSRVVYSPLVGFADRRVTPMEVFGYYAKALPYHVGISLGLLLVLLWAVARAYPGLAVSLLAALVGRTMWAWGDFEPVPDAGDARLGIDDRSTIYWLLRGYVLGDLTHSLDDFAKWYREDDFVDDGDEDGEMETLEREVGYGEDATINFVIRLKDKPNECLRIVVDTIHCTDEI